MPISGRSHRYPQEVGIKQLNRIWLHGVTLTTREELLVKNVLKGYGIVDCK